MTRKQDQPIDFETDFLNLARIALSGRTQDVQVAIRRTAKRLQPSTPGLAEKLSSLLREAPSRASPLRGQADVPVPVDLDSRLQLMQVEAQPALDHEPVFAPALQAALGKVVQERRNPDALGRAGLEPTRSALLVGPPGVGKTMAARWLARELSKPLLILDLAAVMSSFLGRTGTNLRQVLDYAKTIDCILLLDELDAIAKRRDDRGEVGELKRLVTVLIQQIDDWPTTSMLIAATNHPDLLDPAIWRRFEAHIFFPLPDYSSIRNFVENSLSPYVEKYAEWSSVLGTAFSGRSFSDIERELMSARRGAALDGRPLEEHLSLFLDTDALPRQERIKLAAELVGSGLLTQRKAHELTGVARDTIRSRSRTLKAAKRHVDGGNG